MITGKETDVLTWNIKDSTNATIYTKEGDYVLTQYQFGQTFAHEFGHFLGLGDAYNAGNRDGTGVFWQDGYYAPASYMVSDQYGKEYTVRVPEDDIMFNNVYVTDNDIRMVLEAYKTGQVQTFPHGSQDNNNR